MGLFLTDTELQELTGYKLASKQSSWLRARGYYVETNARGIPRVTYTQVEEMRRHNTPANAVIFNRLPDNRHKNLSTRAEPNFNGLRQKIKKPA